MEHSASGDEDTILISDQHIVLCLGMIVLAIICGVMPFTARLALKAMSFLARLDSFVHLPCRDSHACVVCRTSHALFHRLTSKPLEQSQLDLHVNPHLTSHLTKQTSPGSPFGKSKLIFSSKSPNQKSTPPFTPTSTAIPLLTEIGAPRDSPSFTPKSMWTVTKQDVLNRRQHHQNQNQSKQTQEQEHQSRLVLESHASRSFQKIQKWKIFCHSAYLSSCCIAQALSSLLARKWHERPTKEQLDNNEVLQQSGGLNHHLLIVIHDQVFQSGYVSRLASRSLSPVTTAA
jgi:hypothetical protein